MHHALGIIPGIPDELELFLALLGLAGGARYVIVARRIAKSSLADQARMRSKSIFPRWLTIQLIIASLFIFIGIYFLFRGIAYYTSVEKWASNIIKLGIAGVVISLLLFVLRRKFAIQPNIGGHWHILEVVEDGLFIISLLTVFGGIAFEYIYIDPNTYNCVVVESSSSKSEASSNDIACDYLVHALIVTSIDGANTALTDFAPYYGVGTYHSSVCNMIVPTPTETSASNSIPSSGKLQGKYGDYVTIPMRRQLVKVSLAYLIKSTKAADPKVVDSGNSNKQDATTIDTELSNLSRQDSICEDFTIIVKDATTK